MTTESRRALETGSFLWNVVYEGSPQLVLGMTVEPRLREREISGKLVGRSIPKGLSEDGLDRWITDNNFGEPMENLWERGEWFLKDLSLNPRMYNLHADTLLFVIHENPLRVIVSLSFGWGPNDPRTQKLRFDHCGVTVGEISAERGLVIFEDQINLTAHLLPDLVGPIQASSNTGNGNGKNGKSNGK
ncbi:Uncharacterised protein [Candidatus Burarchaeum australiense]|nr:Uncharacterised protein [Candidatus Burarchaeum australiense]